MKHRCFEIALALSMVAAAPAAPALAEEPGPRIDHYETLSERGGVLKHGGSYVRTMSKVTGPGRSRWRVEVEWPDSTGRIRSRQISEAEIGTWAPIWSRVSADRDSAALAVVQGRVIGWSVPVAGPTRLIDQAMPAGTVAPEFDLEAIAARPLVVGYQTTITSLALMGELQTRRIRVERADTVEVAGHLRDCWLVTSPARFAGDSRLTVWVDRRTRRVWQRRGDFDAFAWVHRLMHP